MMAATNRSVQPLQSRTRRAHGFLSVGGTTATVHSTRRADNALGVSIRIGGAELQVLSAMTPTQARSLARALTSAADAIERPKTTAGQSGQAFLYEHADGRCLVAAPGSPSVAGDPGWVRQFPVEIDAGLLQADGGAA